MSSAVRRILVVGGNGFIGSAVCRAALARGIQVTSVSSSGNPYRTPKGHTPAWTSKVDWKQGDALQPQTFAHLFPEVDGVVHTLGTLMEDNSYKRAVREGDLPALVGSLWKRAIGDSGNPLEKGQRTDSNGRPTSYEAMNRDSALRVCEAFLSSPVGVSTENQPRPFVFISAEDIFRPVIPPRYIETKREAERGIEEMMAGKVDYRGVYMRPSLVYHAHTRPLTTPPAVLLDLSAAIHSKVPPSFPTPSSVLRSLGALSKPSSTTTTGSPLESIANALTIPPIHVDHVADAVCVALDSRNDVRGVVGVQRMRELIGWSTNGQTNLQSA
ncbi:mitochondrial protein [Agrocybe pediades]|nr:mitochondrial protein [Agrocybe pediades]